MALVVMVVLVVEVVQTVQDETDSKRCTLRYRLDRPCSSHTYLVCNVKGHDHDGMVWIQSERRVVQTSRTPIRSKGHFRL